ncbi:hypothetical protein EOA13_05445, partial [Mesorhizobium sp. M7A.F.Ca.US.011.01.1.1]|uniref:beta strand repeat-containing protein n=1 Tax=Mesorhizobium sp. M7A.F.Ca.US.011.01.1.1 TaxID=2496741 RepID=UPI000FD2C18E
MTNNIELDSFSGSLNEHSASNEHADQASPAEIRVAQANSTQQPAPAASEPVPVDVGGGAPVKPEAPAEAKAPPAAAPHEYVADASHVVRLPANASIDNIKVDGQNLLLEQADGSVIVVKDGALNVPTFIIGDVEVPRVALLAALESSHVDVAFGADGSMSAGSGGSNSSAGGDFSVPPGGIGDGFDLSALLPPTALQFGLLDRRELFPSIVDRQVSVTATSLLAPTEAASETGLDGGAGQSPGSEAPTDKETSNTGTISIDAPDGIGSIVINGVTVTGVDQHIPGQYGYLTIVSYNPSTGAIEYNYTVTESVSHTDQTPGYDPSTDTVPENFTITVTDVDGDTASTTFAVAIVDDVPTAVADTDSVTEDGPTVADGNVITTSGGADANVTDGVADVKGADGATVTGVEAGTVASASGHVGSVVAGSYGSITIDADGHYSYTLNNGAAAVQALTTGQHLTDTFTYTLTDGDGDISTTTVEITINGTNDVPTVTVPQAGAPGTSVDEAGLPAGSASLTNSETTAGTFSYTNGDGASTVTINGTAVAVGATVAGDYGTLTITAINGTTVSYSYTLATNVNHATDATPFETFTVHVADSDGNVADDPSASFQIAIVDDVPTAVADTDSVTEDGPTVADGNVITASGGTDANVTDGVADVKGADGATVTGVEAGTVASASGHVGSVVAGSYGSITIDADGHYSYTLNNGAAAVQALSSGQHLTDTFTYTLTDGDGDISTTTVEITINGTNDVPTVTVPQAGAPGTSVDEAGLPAGSASLTNSETTAGTFSYTNGDGASTVTINGTAVAVGATVAGDYGTLTITAINGTTVSYSYTLATNVNHATDATPFETFTVHVADSDGNVADDPSASFQIAIVDDVPTAVADTDSVTE